MMNPIRNPLEAGSGASLEAMLSISRSALDCAERLIALNMRASRSVLEDNLSSLNLLMGSRDMPDLFGKQTELAETLIHKVVAYARGVNEVVALNREDLSRVLVGGTVASPDVAPPDVAPVPALPATAGEKAVIDTVIAMIDTASTARDNMIEVANQVSETIVAAQTPEPAPAAPARKRRARTPKVDSGA
jgi:phasin family protein